METILNYATQTSSFVFVLIIVLSVLIFFHELGHYLFARIFSVGVEKFSLGFGPRIFGKTIGRTDYRLSLIPLGGYVKLVGEDPTDDIDASDEPYSFSKKNVWQRIIIVAAGPIFNVVLAWILFVWIAFLTGIPTQLPQIIGVGQNTPAQEAGVQSGDMVIAVNNEVVRTWQEMAALISDSQGKTVQLTVKRQDELIDLNVQPKAYAEKNLFGETIDRFMIGISSVKIRVTDNTISALKNKNFSDELIQSIGQLSDRWYITSQEINTELESILGKESYDAHKDLIWENLSIQQLDYEVKELGITDSVVEGSKHTVLMVKMTVFGLWKLVTGSLSTDTIGGPIAIAQMADQSAKAGWKNLMFFIAVISINLALVNLLPIPVLDGGHLMFFSYEAITRRPVNIRAMEIAQQVGVAFLITVMIAVTYNDIIRSFFS
jgi:regulator of sigma E protease